jgi:LCP family protein required for cell wall assembly
MGRQVFRVIKILLRVGLVVLILLIGGTGYLLVTNQTFRETASAVLGGYLSPSRAFQGREHVDILVIGRDIDLDNRQQPMKTRGRADLTMVVRMDFARRQAAVLSIPRDTRARIPGHGVHKINAAHALGGPALLAGALREMLGVSPDFYVVATFDDLARAIDRLGGVEMVVDKRMDYDDNWGNLHIHLKPGLQRLNGKQAVGLARYRKSNDGDADSDLERIMRQQQLLLAVEKRARAPRCWLALPGAAHELRSRLETDLSFPQMLCLTAFAAGLPQERVESATLPGRMGRVFIYPQLDQARELCARLFPQQ